MSSLFNNRQRHGQIVALLFGAVLAHRAGASVSFTTDVARSSAWMTNLHLQPAIYIQTATSSPEGNLLKVADVTTPQPVDKNIGAPPALYTKEQAKKGLLGYIQNCASCHGPALDGQPGGYSGPALKGAEFADPSYDFHVSDIFNFVAKLMPSATPGSLPPDLYVAIMAFILQQNGYPAGLRELTYDEAMTSSVPIRYYGKLP
jgi:mono/diheme cytochrome c family protein